MRGTSGIPLLADSETSRSQEASAVHDGLADVLRRYDVNCYAASVKVFAVRPRW